MSPGDLLAQIPLFFGMSDEDRAALGERLVARDYAAGATVFAQGDKGNAMYIVRTGARVVHRW